MATLAELPSAEEWEHLRPFLDTLTYRQRRVIERCYGFDGNPGWSLDQIGKMFNLTRERVRQIRNEAIQHLRLREAPWPQ